MTKQTILFPYDQKGDLLTYEQPYRTVKTVPAFEFEDEILIQDYSRGRSSVLFVGRGSSGQTYHFFISDFILLLPLLKKSIIKGVFTQVKKGSNFGTKLVRVVK